MASPQKENGYTAIANEILDAVAMLKINATQFRILIVVWRYTYGFQRKSHVLSETYIAKATGIHKKQIGREIQDMIKRKIITEVSKPTFSKAREISFNKDYFSWVSTDSLTGVETVDQTGNGLVDPTGNGLVDQERKYKENLKKDIYGEFQNVRLTADEYEKLSTRLTGYEKRIEDLSAYLESTGKKYKSHYATILTWARKDGVHLAKPKEPDEPVKQFESEEQRQAQNEFVSNLLKKNKNKIDMEDLWGTIL